MTIDNGQVANADEVLALNAINQVYTGSGFDSDSNVSDPDEQSHELDAVAANPNSNYAVVKITGTSIVQTGSESNAGNVQLKAQIKEIGQSYADVVAYATVLSVSQMPVNTTETIATTYEIVATLTAGMKTNGFQIKVFSKSDEINAASRARFVNIQTIQELRA